MKKITIVREKVWEQIYLSRPTVQIGFDIDKPKNCQQQERTTENKVQKMKVDVFIDEDTGEIIN